MKHFFLFLSIFPMVFLKGQDQQNVGMCKEIHEQEKESWLKAHTSLTSNALNNYNLVYHRCYWEIDPAVNFIKGSITSYFKPTTTAFNQLEFDLTTSLTVDSVIYHNTPLSFVQQTTDILQINFISPLPINTIDSLTVYYKGIPPTTGFGSFVQSTHTNTPIIWTLSEPFGAKTWWPCKQNLADKIDSIDIFVKTPYVNKVASNGVLVSEINAGADKIHHWKSRYPIAAYLVAIAVTNYVAYSDYVPLQSGTLQVLNYVYPEDLNAIQPATQEIVKIITFFDSLLIEYPFAKEKYGHAQFGWGGGMEHQTMSFMGGFYLSLMAHECAHQWFGNHVTCGSWEDIWLNEGFASYFEWQVTERYLNAGWLSGLPNLVSSITAYPDGSVLCDDTTKVSRIFDGRLSYAKGAFLLRMLRWKIGDSAFFAGIKNYLNDPLLKNNYAKTPQLINHFVASSGQNLTPFFNQWYYNQGYPSYLINWVQTGNTVSVTINQSQSHPTVTFFEMPVPIRFESATKDTIFIFNNTSPGQTFSFTSSYTFYHASFDPEYRILSANNILLGLNQLALKKENITLYPNPANKSLSLRGLPKGTVINEINVIDVLGKMIHSENLDHNLSDVFNLNCENFKPGIYSLLVKTNIGSVSLKFVKE